LLTPNVVGSADFHVQYVKWQLQFLPRNCEIKKLKT
jgi:hypothetical protein